MIESVTKDLCFRGAFCLRPFSRRIRAPPFLFDCLHKIKFLRRITNENHQFEILLPNSLYARCACAVPDELKELLDQFILEDYRYDAKRRYHRAFYSYDALDGIENDILMFGPSPCELYEQKERHAALYAALLKLPEKQLRRIYANYYLGMSKAQIARIEGVNESGIRKSIRSGLNMLRKELNFFCNGVRK